MKPTFRKDGTISNRGAFLTPFKEGNKAAARVVVDIITGIEYPSIGDAAKALGMRSGTLRDMMCNKRRNKTTLQYKEGGPRRIGKRELRSTLKQT